jgi:CRISPR-associated protein Cmr2
MKHLMIFAIGPVQDFIATARRSRDLWYGSWMLSELSKAAAKKIGELPPAGELIFPYPSRPEALQTASGFNTPNKIVAVIDGDPKSVGEIIRKAINTRLGELWADARSHVKGGIDDALAQQQIDKLLEFYWVSVPYEEGKDSYSNVRDSAEAMFAARKVTRDFAQATGSSVPKSSLDGARESVIPKQAYPERKDTEDVKRKKAENLYKHYHARPGEQLSGVDILKRLGNPDNSPKFKSTSDMAALPFLAQIDRKKGAGKGAELIAEIRDLTQDFEEIDGTSEGLVFESRFAEWAETQPSADELRKKFNTVLKKYAGDPPSPYYALLAADGDNMGMVIDAQTDLQKHRDLSQALSDFASQVPGFVKAGDGVLIYAGGDDVLAYLPLHTALDFAKQIESAFKEKMQNFKAKDGILPTLSVGIAITHHLEPLADALELARKAEKEAKSAPGKNGLAIIVSKRSGADRAIKDKFAALDTRLRKLIQFSESDAISAGAAYELQNLHRDLSKTNIPPKGQTKEALRIISRKREAGSEAEIKEKVLNAFKQWIETEKISLDELALEMIIANLFANAEDTKEAK